MTQSRSVSYAALLLAVLALMVSSVAVVGGVAEAAGHKIGKNLVVTKSIKKGAVTGEKIRDGSVTAADLAPGTIPTVAAPVPGKQVVSATCSCLPTAAGSGTFVPPIGANQGPPVNASALVPVAVRLSDFQFLSGPQGVSQSVAFSVRWESPVDQDTHELALCTIPGGASTCTSTKVVSVPSGNRYWFWAEAGAGGGFWSNAFLGYTMQLVG